MPDLEQRIRAYVENLDPAQLEPMSSDALLRSVRRRRVTRVAGGAIATLAIVGTVAFVGTQLTDGGAAGEPPAAGTSATPLTESQARRDIIEGLSEPNVDPVAWFADDATDYLPNRLFAVGRQPAEALSDRVVVADITDVVEGKAYTAHNKPVDDWHDQDFYGYKTAVVRMQVTPLVGDGPPRTITASLRLSSSDGLEPWRTGLRSFSPVVAFLERGSELDSAEYTLAGHGATMLLVNDDGTLTAPFRPHWLDVAATLDELRAEAHRPPSTEHVPSGGVFG